MAIVALPFTLVSDSSNFAIMMLIAATYSATALLSLLGYCFLSAVFFLILLIASKTVIDMLNVSCI